MTQRERRGADDPLSVETEKPRMAADEAGEGSPTKNPISPTKAGRASRLSEIELDTKEVQRRYKLLLEVKPWTVASRLKYQCQRQPDPKLRHKDVVLELVAMLCRLCPYLHMDVQKLDTQLSFCKCMAVLTMKKGQVICKQGDQANGFFVILTGKVAIKGTYAGKSFYTSLNQGKTFGDLAIKNQGTRTASAIAESHCDLIVVEPEDFVQIFGAHLSDTTHMIATRLKHLVRVFETVPFPLINQMANYMSEVRFPRGHLFHLDTGSRLYFIEEGECTLVESADPARVRTNNVIFKLASSTAFILNPRLQIKFGVDPSKIELGTLVKGGFFGESCVFPELQRGWQCRAETDVVLYQIPQDLFVRQGEVLVSVIHDEAMFRNNYFAGRRGMPKDDGSVDSFVYRPAQIGSRFDLPGHKSSQEEALKIALQKATTHKYSRFLAEVKENTESLDKMSRELKVPFTPLPTTRNLSPKKKGNPHNKGKLDQASVRSATSRIMTDTPQTDNQWANTPLSGNDILQAESSNGSSQSGWGTELDPTQLQTETSDATPML